jgi:CRISPR type IV-associated protein Csf3
MEPLKITFTFSSPIVLVSDYPIHLDALLAFAVSQDAEDAGSENPWADSEDLSHLFESYGEGEDMVWKASKLNFTPMSEPGTMNMIRKTDPEKIMYDHDAGKFKPKRKLTRVDTQKGQMKAYQWLCYYQWMEKAEAYCIGDAEEIEDMLTYIKFVGKQGRNGYGVVKDIVVEPCAEAKQKWMNRVMPESFKDEQEEIQYAKAMHCLRPPYWKKLNRVVALEPVA